MGEDVPTVSALPSASSSTVHFLPLTHAPDISFSMNTPNEMQNGASEILVAESREKGCFVLGRKRYCSTVVPTSYAEETRRELRGRGV